MTESVLVGLLQYYILFLLCVCLCVTKRQMCVREREREREREAVSGSRPEPPKTVSGERASKPGGPPRASRDQSECCAIKQTGGFADLRASITNARDGDIGGFGAGR